MQKLKKWRNGNQRNIAFFNSIKNKETPVIYNDFIEKDEIFIPHTKKKKKIGKYPSRHKGVK